MKEKTKEIQVPEDHQCEVCGQKAVVCDSGSKIREGNHYYCLDHHVRWCQCWTHEQMVEEWQKSKASTSVT